MAVLDGRDGRSCTLVSPPIRIPTRGPTSSGDGARTLCFGGGILLFRIQCVGVRGTGDASGLDKADPSTKGMSPAQPRSASGDQDPTNGNPKYGVWPMVTNWVNPNCPGVSTSVQSDCDFES